MRVLSIDPGFDRVGVAVLEGASGSEVLLHSDCIQTNRKDDFPVRLHEIGATIKALLNTYAPDTVAIETLFFNTNQKTAMRVAEARGVVIYEAQQYGCTIYEHTPLEIKIALTGYGKASKEQVAHMVCNIVQVAEGVKHDDELDAIAVGITCIARA